MIENNPADTIEQLRTFLEIWIHPSHLQTFEDREKFRKQARRLLDKTDPEKDEDECLPHNIAGNSD